MFCVCWCVLCDVCDVWVSCCVCCVLCLMCFVLWFVCAHTQRISHYDTGSFSGQQLEGALREASVNLKGSYIVAKVTVQHDWHPSLATSMNLDSKRTAARA